MPFSKPIPNYFIYKTQNTTDQIPVAFRNPTADEISQVESITQKIFDLIVLDN